MGKALPRVEEKWRVLLLVCRAFPCNRGINSNIYSTFSPKKINEVK